MSPSTTVQTVYAIESKIAKESSPIEAGFLIIDDGTMITV
jgi:hypothetical protein